MQCEWKTFIHSHWSILRLARTISNMCFSCSWFYFYFCYHCFFLSFRLANFMVMSFPSLSTFGVYHIQWARLRCLSLHVLWLWSCQFKSVNERLKCFGPIKIAERTKFFEILLNSTLSSTISTTKSSSRTSCEPTKPHFHTTNIQNIHSELHNVHTVHTLRMWV